MKGIFFILIIVAVGACYKEKPIVPQDVILNYDSAPKSLTVAADGASTVELLVKLNKDAVKENAVVNFKTDKGTFDESGNASTSIKAIPDDISNPTQLQAIAHLKSLNQVDTAYATAEIAGVILKMTIYFIRAYPGKITLSSDKLALKSNIGDAVTFTVNLLRKPGIPSTNTAVSISIWDGANQVTTGIFRNKSTVESDAAGHCQFIYSLPNVAFIGKKLQVKSMVVDRPVLKDSIDLYIIE